MDMQTFWQGVERIADEFNIGKHPLAQLVHDGKATKQQTQAVRCRALRDDRAGFRSLHRQRLYQHV